MWFGVRSLRLLSWLAPPATRSGRTPQPRTGWARAGQADSGFVAFYRQRFTLPLFYYDTSEIQKPWELLKYFRSDRNLKILLRIAGCFQRSDCPEGRSLLFQHDNSCTLSPPENESDTIIIASLDHSQKLGIASHISFQAAGRIVKRGG